MLQQIIQQTPAWTKSIVAGLALMSCGRTTKNISECPVGKEGVLADIISTLQTYDSDMYFYDISIGKQQYDMINVYLDSGINVEAFKGNRGIWLHDRNGNDNPETMSFYDDLYDWSPDMSTINCSTDSVKQVFWGAIHLVRSIE